MTKWYLLPRMATFRYCGDVLRAPSPIPLDANIRPAKKLVRIFLHYLGYFRQTLFSLEIVKRVGEAFRHGLPLHRFNQRPDYRSIERQVVEIDTLFKLYQMKLGGFSPSAHCFNIFDVARSKFMNARVYQTSTQSQREKIWVMLNILVSRLSV